MKKNNQKIKLSKKEQKRAEEISKLIVKDYGNVIKKLANT